MMRSFIGSAVVVCLAATSPGWVGSASGQVVSPAMRAPTNLPTRVARTPALSDAEQVYLDPINHLRDRLGRPKLVWSSSLAQEAAGIAARGALGACSLSTVAAAAQGREANIFWAPALRRVDGQAQAQAISPRYAVSVWADGRSSYDPRTKTCRGSSDCDAYLRMTSQAVRVAGCARLACASQAQIIVCRFGFAEGASTAQDAHDPPRQARS
jgi:hypothetical protein